MNWKVISRRTDQAKRAMCANILPEESSNNIKHHLALQKYGNVGIRLSIIPALYLLYKRKFFQGKTPFMIREVLTIGVFIGYCAVGEFALNEYMWSNVRNDVMSFGKLKKREFEQIERISSKSITSDRLDQNDFLNDE